MNDVTKVSSHPKGIIDLPFAETHEKNAAGDMYVMKEKYAVPYRETVAVQLKSWLEGKPVHNTFANECCPDFSCCHPENLWTEERRKVFANAPEGIREAMASDAIMAIVYPEVTAYIAGVVNPEETKH